VVWTDAKIQTFWKICGHELSSLFFSRTAGELVLHIVRPHLGASVLEVGCGDGFLAGKLRLQGYQILGTDISPPAGQDFVALKSTELATLGAARFDSALAVEVLEHLLPPDLPVTLDAIRYVLKSDGRLIFTTPLEESLRDNFCVCPDCHAVFHRWQHQQAFTTARIGELLEQHGFRVVKFRYFECPPTLVPRLVQPLASLLGAYLKRKLRKSTTVITIATPA
jgi:SAM-dependent methyltransferase